MEFQIKSWDEFANWLYKKEKHREELEQDNYELQKENLKLRSENEDYREQLEMYQAVSKKNIPAYSVPQTFLKRESDLNV